MSGKLVTISRRLGQEEARDAIRSGKILRFLRGLVKEIRSKEPKLAGCELYDIGIVRRGSEFEVKLYFFV